MATKTQIRFSLGLAVALAAVSIAMPGSADAFFHRQYNGAPEVDPSTLSSAIALAMGGLAVLGDKLRRR
jgi:hypothetical protein